MKAASDWMCAVERQVEGMERLGLGSVGAQHAGIVRMFVASDSVRLAQQTKGFQSDEDQCRFFIGDENLCRAWGVLIKYRIGISFLRRKKKWCVLSMILP